MKILIVPGNNSLSHLTKGLAIAQELQARGAEVLITCSRANSTFLEQFAIPCRILPDIQENDGAAMPTMYWFKDPDKLLSCIEAERALFRETRPDKVLGIFRFTAKVSAALEGIPYDSLICGCMLPESRDLLGYPEDRPGADNYRRLLEGFFSYAAIKFNNAMQGAGTGAIKDIRELLKGDRTFLWDFPGFTPLAANSGLVHVGPVFWHQWPFDLEDIAGLISSGRPLALITSGTGDSSTQLTSRICRILRQMGFKLLIASGGQDKLCRLHPDDNLVTTCRFAPFKELLPHVSLLVSHGGQMTVFEALLHKVPVLVLPLQAEQAQNGICLERLGCGKMLVPPQIFTGDHTVYANAFEEIPEQTIISELTGFLQHPHLAGNLAEAARNISRLPGEILLADYLTGKTRNRGLILVHGYTGNPSDLQPLAVALEKKLGAGNVINLELPGHGQQDSPAFDLESFRATIHAEVGGLRELGKDVILVGHSTGGSLILDYLHHSGFTPSLLVLLATPHRIDLAYLDRWTKHRSSRAPIPFRETAKMISLINSTSSAQTGNAFPVLLLHGEQDQLVPPGESVAWLNNFPGPARLVILPGLGHQFYQQADSRLASDLICRAVVEAGEHPLNDQAAVALKTLQQVEPAAKPFIDATPGAARHLARSPSVRKFGESPPGLAPEVSGEPVIANIEITTRCNLKCRHCARAVTATSGEVMTPATFRSILGCLPHSFQVNLVGLGEPLTHPDLPELVAIAAGLRRKVGLVTNAMLLDDAMARKLLAAGLHSIAFSIDGADQALAETLRQGTDLDRVVANIRNFVARAEALNRPVATAVFSAVSMASAPFLSELFDLAASLGVSVLMLTDLNFRHNQADSLWKNIDHRLEETIRQAVRRAFANRLPVLSVHGLEEFGLATRYDDFLLIPPASLYQRNGKRTWCCSPWQTVPVDVNGRVTLCDCQPEIKLGNILHSPLNEIWNGKAIKSYRRKMLGPEPPPACLICPRF